MYVQPSSKFTNKCIHVYILVVVVVEGVVKYNLRSQCMLVRVTFKMKWWLTAALAFSMVISMGSLY